MKTNKVAQCWIEGGIVMLRFNPGIMDLECATKSVELRLEVSEGNTHPFFVDTSEITNITKEARDYFASKEGVKQISASGLVFRSNAHKLIGNFFLKINKPNVPVRLFNSEKEAKDWLKQFLND